MGDSSGVEVWGYALDTAKIQADTRPQFVEGGFMDGPLRKRLVLAGRLLTAQTLQYGLCTTLCCVIGYFILGRGTSVLGGELGAIRSQQVGRIGFRQCRGILLRSGVECGQVIPGGLFRGFFILHPAG